MTAIEGISIRSYLDHHVPIQFAHDLRKVGFDVITARDVGHERASDEFHLAWASDHQRVVISSDFDDFPHLASQWFFSGRDHAGIILMEQTHVVPYGVLLRRLLRLFDTRTADDMVNVLEWLDRRWSDPADLF